jgi:hypothetical protein
MFYLGTISLSVFNLPFGELRHLINIGKNESTGKIVKKIDISHIERLEFSNLQMRIEEKLKDLNGNLSLIGKISDSY